MRYLEKVREVGVVCLKNNDLLKAASHFAECLRFVDPKYDEIFHEKFLVVKVDAVNKLMYCLFELESARRGPKLAGSLSTPADSRYPSAERIVT